MDGSLSLISMWEALFLALGIGCWCFGEWGKDCLFGGILRLGRAFGYLSGDFFGDFICRNCNVRGLIVDTFACEQEARSLIATISRSRL